MALSAPSPRSLLLSCAACAAELPASLLGADEEGVCARCGREVRVFAFPALVRPLAAEVLPARVVLGDESTCYTHTHSRASVVCESCGRFLCSLCDLEVDGRHVCPLCLDAGVRAGSGGLEGGRVLWDYVALALALVPLVLFLWCLTIVTAPLTLVVVYWKRAAPASLVRRSWPRFLAASILAILQLAGWVVLAVVLASEWSHGR